MKENKPFTQRGNNQWTYKDRPYCVKEWLYQKYVVEKLSLKKIAKICGVSNKSGTTIHRWIKKFGFTPHKAIAKGENNFKWNGGCYISPSGYKYVMVDKNHPRGVKKGKYTFYVPEQHLIMEKYLGRFLKKDEVIHHLNGVKLDNKLSNLQLHPNSSSHVSFEMKINSFAKQLIWGNLSPKLGNKVFKLFQEFIKE